MQNKDFRNPNSQPQDIYNQNQYQQNSNAPKNYKYKIQNNLINAEFDYPKDFSPQQMSNLNIPQNNPNLNNNLINNNLIYQNYNQEPNINYYFDPKRKKQEEYKRMLDQQRFENNEIKEKNRVISNNNFINNNININNNTTNKCITKPEISEEERIKKINKWNIMKL